jgi:phosphoribosylanthranilate isomerase
MIHRLPVKICGMRDAENIRQVASLKPDYLGFIFYTESPRFVGDDFRLPEDLPASIRKVGVFVNETADNILSRAKAVGLDCIQLHGNESVEQCNILRGAGLTLIKVFSVSYGFDFNVTKPYIPAVDYFLFDTKGKYYGGNANTFDWEILKRYDQEIPFFLSGGLSPENVGDVGSMEGMNLYALDLNSGVEVSPGLKSIEKIETLLTRLPLRIA